MIREIGEPRFEFDCVSTEALEKLIDLKRKRYQRGKTFDILSVEWAANLLRQLHHTNGQNFQGILSALWVGDKMIAGHFGMLSNHVMHYWFPAYDIKYAKYSPGTQMIMNVAEHAAKLGIDKVDFGYGDDPYKFKFCNGRETVSCGQFRFNRLAFQLSLIHI